jgi:hypothetical protein
LPMSTFGALCGRSLKCCESVRQVPMPYHDDIATSILCSSFICRNGRQIMAVDRRFI